MLRVIIKIILFPIIILLRVLEIVCDAAASLSGVIFRLIGGIFILTAFLSYGFGLEPWSVAVQMIFGGAVFITLPLIGTFLSAGIAFLNTVIHTI